MSDNYEIFIKNLYLMEINVRNNIFTTMLVKNDLGFVFEI
jgi:hypothetical protein